MKKKEIIIGKNPVIEALKNGAGIDSIWISRTVRDTHEIEKLCKEQNIPVKKVPVEKLDYMLFPIYQNKNVSHQGVLAILFDFQYYKVEDIHHLNLSEGKSSLFVLLDRITDVGNFGAIARSALCFDVDALIIPTHNSVSVSPQSIKASAGALHHLPICRVDSIWDCIDYLLQSGFQLIGASEKANKGIEEIDNSVPTVIVLGNENTGISLPVQKMLTDQVKISMNREKFDSLNVSVSAGILFHQLYHSRQIRHGK